MPARFEFPDIRPLGNLCLIVGGEIPLIFIRVAFSEMGWLIIVWSMVIVK